MTLTLAEKIEIAKRATKRMQKFMKVVWKEEYDGRGKWEDVEDRHRFVRRASDKAYSYYNERVTRYSQRNDSDKYEVALVARDHFCEWGVRWPVGHTNPYNFRVGKRRSEKWYLEEGDATSAIELNGLFYELNEAEE
jgi:hypothetical protein